MGPSLNEIKVRMWRAIEAWYGVEPWALALAIKAGAFRTTHHTYSLKVEWCV